MTIEQDFYDFLAPVSDHIHPVVLPQKHSLPALTYSLNNSRPQYSADGPSSYPVTMQVDCWATTYAGVKALQSAVRSRVDGYTGVMGSHYVDLVEIDNELDSKEPDTGLYRVTMLIQLFHRSA